MRTRTAGENTILAAATKGVTAAKIEVKDAAGVYQDWFSRLLSVSWGASIDQPIVEVRLALKRDSGPLASLSPFRGDSTLNIGGAAIDAGRDIRISPATTAWGVAPVAGDYKLLFQGKTADIGFANAAMDVLARDPGGALVKRQIKVATEYGSEAGTAIQTVIQDILNDWAAGITLYTPVDPGFLIRPYEQAKGSVFEALRTLAGTIGWDIRYLWDSGSSTFRLTLFEPDRAKTTPDWTFAKNRIRVTQLGINPEFVRNYIEVSFLNSVTGVRETVFATDAISVARFDEQWMEIVEADDSPISTTAEAQALADAALSDLAWPIAEKQIEAPFFWPVELNDLIRFTANDVHSDEDIDLAVTGYEHRLDGQTARTVLTTRGKPAGFYKTWLRRGKSKPPSATEALARIRGVVDATAGTVDLFVAVIGPSDIYPAAVQVRKDDPVTGSVIASFTVPNATEIGPVEQAALNNIVLPLHQADNYYAVVTTALGTPLIGYTSVDRDKDPGGSVVPLNLQAYPGFVCRYDDDVTQIVIITPTANKTYNGLSGGGSLTYRVGELLDGGVLREPPFTEDEVRSGYRIEYKGGGSTFIPFDGALLGPPVSGQAAGYGLPSVLPVYELNDATGALSLRVSRHNLDHTYGFMYIHSTSSYFSTPVGATTVFFTNNPVELRKVIALAALGAAATAYLTIWPFGYPPKDAAPGTPGPLGAPLRAQRTRGLVGPRIVWDYHVVAIGGDRDELGLPGPASGGYQALFSLSITDPGNLGGTLTAWLVGDGGYPGSSPDFSGAADLTTVVPAGAPYSVDFTTEGLLRVMVVESMPVLVKFRFVNSAAVAVEEIVSIDSIVGIFSGGGGLNPGVRIDDTGTGERSGQPTGPAGAGTPGWSTGPVTVGGLKDMSRQYPGNLLEPFAYRPRTHDEYAVVQQIWGNDNLSFTYEPSKELAPGEYCSVSAFVKLTNVGGVFCLALGFFDAGGGQLGPLVLSEPVTGTTVLTRRFIRNVQVPALAYVVAVMRVDKTFLDTTVQSPGAGWLEDPILVRGAIDPLPNTAPSAVTRQAELEDRAGLLMTNVLEDEAREGNAGVPGARTSGANVTDAANLSTLVQTTDRYFQNAELREESTTVGGVNTRSIVRGVGPTFLETFEKLPAEWTNIGGAGVSSLVTEGVTGGKALQGVGHIGGVFPHDIPFDPSKLYRLRARVRTTVDPTTGGKLFYIGVRCFDKNHALITGANSGYVYPCIYGSSYTVAAGWQVVTGWFKGATGTLVQPAASATNPSGLEAATAYFRPVFIANSSAGDGTSQIDEIYIDWVDEDGVVRAYSGLATDGDLTGNIDGDTEVQSGDFFVGTTKLVRFGTIGTPGSLAKTVRVSAAELVPNASGYTWQFTGSYFSTAGATTSLNAFIALLIPNGATITAVRARTYRQGGGDGVTVALIRSDDSGGATSLGSVALAVNATWTTITITGLSELVNNSYAYYLDCTLLGNAGNCRFAWFEIDYTVPDYAKAL